MRFAYSTLRILDGRRPPYPNDAISITNRYFTSLFSAPYEAPTGGGDGEPGT